MAETMRGRRILVTGADRYLGPAVVETFERHGAEVIADTTDYAADPEAPARVVARAGRIDVLVPNFAGPLRLLPLTKMFGPASETPDADVQALLDELLWPMTRFVRAALPQMIERRAGKIVAVTSASPMRGIPGVAVYSGMRGYQNAFLQSVGAEAAPHNVQVNAVGPAFIENPSYLPPDLDAQTRQRLIADIPAGRIGEAWEAAELVLALAGDASNCLVGQVVPVAGGWVTR